MIRRDEPQTTWVIHQAAHAYVSGQIAAHWTGLEADAPRDALLIAAYSHDAGWANAERQPRINAQGVPRTFTEMDLDEHFDIWDASIEAVFLQNRYAGLLTSLHCTALYEQRLRFVADPPAARAQIDAFLERQYTQQKTLTAALRDHPLYGAATEPEQLQRNLRLLQIWDYLSLLLCMSPVAEQSLDEVPGYGCLRVAGSGLRGMQIDPFPLDQPLTLWLDARQVTGLPFETDEDLRHALAGVPYKPLVFEIAQASEGRYVNQS